MKEKLIGLISVGALFTSLILTGAYLVWEQVEQNVYGMITSELTLGLGTDRRGIAKVPNVDIKTQKAIRKLQKRLKTLRMPEVPEQGPVDFEMLGYELPKSGDPSAQDDTAFGDYSFGAARRQIISMTYISNGVRYAVVNGRLLKEGDAINNELRIKTITPNRVLIVDKAGAQWVKTSNRRVEKARQAESSQGGTDPSGGPASATKAAKAGTPRSKIEQITEGLQAIQQYSETLRAIE